MRADFLVKLEKVPLEKRVYIDESGIGEYLVREYGRALRGVKVEDSKRGKKFQRTNVVAAKVGDKHGYGRACLCYPPGER